MNGDSCNKKSYIFQKFNSPLFDKNLAEVNKINIKLLSKFSLLAGIVTFGMIFYLFISKSNFRNPSFFGYKYIIIYATLFLACILTHLYCVFIASKHTAFVIPVFYWLFLIFYAFGIFNRFYAVPIGQVFVIELVVIVMPYIILDRTWHIYVIEIILFVVFILFDVKYQGRIPYNAWSDDILNMMVSMLVGLIGGHAVRKSRFQALENGRIYILQRNTDELTNLPNRRKLFHELRKSFDGRAPKIKCLFIADIDFFKRYNDTFGHPAGDEVLHRIGECFNKFCSDTGFEIYRYGGEEFVGIYRSSSPIDFPKAVHSLCKSVRDLKISHDAQNLSFVTVSIGFATSEKATPSDYEQFISMADSALYQAKSKGRNCTIEYDASTCSPQS